MSLYFQTQVNKVRARVERQIRKAFDWELIPQYDIEELIASAIANSSVFYLVLQSDSSKLNEWRSVKISKLSTLDSLLLVFVKYDDKNFPIFKEADEI